MNFLEPNQETINKVNGKPYEQTIRDLHGNQARVALQAVNEGYEFPVALAIALTYPE